GTAADRPSADYVAGATANAALVALTQALGASSLRDGVRVVGINPGLTLTDRMEQLLRDRADRTLGNPARWAELVPTDPAPASVDQIADVAVFLASERAGHISGTTLTVDGGNAGR
ncbi:MAG: SDR family oxidoreductase, partial [Actinomycetota bacterium]